MSEVVKPLRNRHRMVYSYNCIIGRGPIHHPVHLQGWISTNGFTHTNRPQLACEKNIQNAIMGKAKARRCASPSCSHFRLRRLLQGSKHGRKLDSRNPLTLYISSTGTPLAFSPFAVVPSSAALPSPSLNVSYVWRPRQQQITFKSCLHLPPIHSDGRFQLSARKRRQG